MIPAIARSPAAHVAELEIQVAAAKADLAGRFQHQSCLA